MAINWGNIVGNIQDSSGNKPGGGGSNTSGGTYYYMAWAENPFKTARAH